MTNKEITKEYLELAYKIVNSEWPGERTVELLNASGCWVKFKGVLTSDEEMTGGLLKAANRLADEVSLCKNFHDTWKIYCQLWGINLPDPWRWIYKDKFETPSKKYVYVSFIDYDSKDDLYGHQRSCLEPYYGTGKEQTLAEFWAAIKKDYTGCDWTEPVGIDGPYDSPALITYEWVDGLHTVKKE